MNPEPITISLDYLIEVSDDGSQADEPDPEVIVIPPPSLDSAASPEPTPQP
jgi:hypothetical protein